MPGRPPLEVLRVAAALNGGMVVPLHDIYRVGDYGKLVGYAIRRDIFFWNPGEPTLLWSRVRDRIEYCAPRELGNDVVPIL